MLQLQRIGGSIVPPCCSCFRKSSIGSSATFKLARRSTSSSPPASSSFLPSSVSRTRPPHSPAYSTSPQFPSKLPTPSPRPLPYPIPSYFRILALESSADDTCASVVDSDRKILSNVVKKQHHLHAQFGGIHPLWAQNAHTKEMPGVIKQALDEASVTLDEIDGIAFTQGPGMQACLDKSCSAAGALAAATGKPLFGVNHMQAHALTPLMTEEDPPTFPYLTFLISGGHSQILLSTSYDDHRIIVDTGATAVGVAYDRVGSEIGIPSNPTYGFGRAVEDLAASIPPLPIPSLVKPFWLPKPSTPEFSFVAPIDQALAALHDFAPPESGAHHLAHNKETITLEQKVAVARAFQETVAEMMLERLTFVKNKLRRERNKERKSGREGFDGELNLSSLVLSGGVASNKYLRMRLKEFSDKHSMRLIVPPIELCTDNAAMIGNVAVDRFREGKNQLYSDVLPRKKWSIEHLFAERDDFGNEIVPEVVEVVVKDS